MEHSVWTEKGIFSGRGSQFCEIDCTSMGVRLLRMHGYNVDPSIHFFIIIQIFQNKIIDNIWFHFTWLDVLEHFKQQDGKFSCYGGQMIESASPIYNLYRAAQLRFPGEEILEEASKFAYNFLQQKIANHQLQEKWVIYHHFIDEVGHY